MMKSRLYRKKIKKIGLAPGTLILEGEQKTEKSTITLLEYNEQEYRENIVEKVEQCFPLKEGPTVTWINVSGIHEIKVIEKLGNNLGLHPLVMEDILDTGHRPKIEDSGDYITLILKILSYDDTKDIIDTDQISIILGPHYVISFQEKDDIFHPIRQRIHSGKCQLRKTDSDYLAYSLIDLIIDSYFAIFEKLGERIEVIEEELVSNPTTKTLHEIHGLKNELLLSRKSIWPLRELTDSLERSESPLIMQNTHVFLRDVYDHTIQIMDIVESLRDTIAGMLDIYLSSVSNKMNAVMKVLTLIATIFIPLTFLAGVYGMNFKYMPELELNWAYPVVLFIMFLIAVSMVLFFKKKNWL